jgi:hypothetical protein
MQIDLGCPLSPRGAFSDQAEVIVTKQLSSILHPDALLMCDISGRGLREHGAAAAVSAAKNVLLQHVPGLRHLAILNAKDTASNQRLWSSAATAAMHDESPPATAVPGS